MTSDDQARAIRGHTRGTFWLVYLHCQLRLAMFTCANTQSLLPCSFPVSIYRSQLSEQVTDLLGDRTLTGLGMVTEGAAPIETVDRSIDSSRSEVRRLTKQKETWKGKRGKKTGQISVLGKSNIVEL